MTKILSYDDNSCAVEYSYETLEYTDEMENVADPQMVTNKYIRHFWAPREGGYVYDVTHKPGTSGKHVCAGLRVDGCTLRWGGPKAIKFIDLIREHVR